MDVDVILDEQRSRAVFTVSGRVIAVDASDLDFLLINAGSPARLAASRIGLNEVIRRLTDELGEGLTRDVIEGYVMDALILAARRRDACADEAFTAVDVIWRTPLVLCEGVVRSRHLLLDVARFRAAAVAVARIEEDDVVDASVPERTALWADELTRWRELYCAPGSVQRSVNRTLARFGDDASGEALWGLRRVPLDAPLPTLQHLEVLGCLGARQATMDNRAVIDPALADAVLRASAEELGTALVMIDEGELDRVVFGNEPPAMRLAEILTTIPIDRLRHALERRVRFSDLLETSLDALRDVLKIDVETIAPPVPLPRVPGVRFLATVGEIMREGVDMDNCVATRAPRALAGECYLFHVDHADTRATVELSASGEILEARGPSNGHSPAVDVAMRLLACWAAPLRFAALGPPDTPTWSSSAPQPPAGYTPVATLGDLARYVAALTSTSDPSALPQVGDEHVLAWALSLATEAIAGQRAIAVQLAAGHAFELWALDEAGLPVVSSMMIRGTHSRFDARLRPPADMRREPRDDSDDDEDVWFLTTPVDGTPSPDTPN